MLNLRNLGKHFANGGETLPLFAGLDLKLSPGETCLLLGQSGCGKSTLLNLIAGLIAPDEGEIWLGETRLDTQSPDERARLRGRHFGIVYQDFNLLPTLTVLENLCLPLEINHLPRDMARLDALLERLGMSHKRHAWPEQLSGGQRQWVALARALVHQPTWLLADEPTGSLDEHNAEQVMGLMMAAVRDTGAGLLLVSHNPGYGALADRVLRLEGGLLLEAGPHG
ncbi:ABC transporter ATP-binding protein [Aeromonas media]|uniref:ABC transporter ATP-binding protein n=1 Tax=Aeromonas media TaxID=651 RepID=UPI001BCEBBE7|nr:ABC transporter ATP-binding protein [Aeromonas media]MBS4699437.1 ABC transporter ATP-binding protein [Aeromonas media]